MREEFTRNQDGFREVLLITPKPFAMTSNREEAFSGWV
jgi:hypothetical protein